MGEIRKSSSSEESDAQMEKNGEDNDREFGDDAESEDGRLRCHE